MGIKPYQGEPNKNSDAERFHSSMQSVPFPFGLESWMVLWWRGGNPKQRHLSEHQADPSVCAYRYVMCQCVCARSSHKAHPKTQTKIRDAASGSTASSAYLLSPTFRRPFRFAYWNRTFRYQPIPVYRSGF
jgi:hypothetical protein